MLTVAIPKRNKLQNIIVLTPKDGSAPSHISCCSIFFHTLRPRPQPEQGFMIKQYITASVYFFISSEYLTIL